MSLPEILAPSLAPAFLVSGHSVDEGDVYARLAAGTGPMRVRRTKTTQERRVGVEWLLSAAAMQAVDFWFEQVLLVGSLPFSARLPNQGPGKLWWAATWEAPYTATPQKISGSLIWRVRGVLVLQGSGSATPPVASGLRGEIEIRLAGSATIPSSGALAGEVRIALMLDAPLRGEVLIQLEVYESRFMLIGDGFKLSIGDGRLLKIN